MITFNIEVSLFHKNIHWFDNCHVFYLKLILSNKLSLKYICIRHQTGSFTRLVHEDFFSFQHDLLVEKALGASKCSNKEKLISLPFNYKPMQIPAILSFLQMYIRLNKFNKNVKKIIVNLAQKLRGNHLQFNCNLTLVSPKFPIPQNFLHAIAFQKGAMIKLKHVLK